MTLTNFLYYVSKQKETVDDYINKAISKQNHVLRDVDEDVVEGYEKAIDKGFEIIKKSSNETVVFDK